MTANQTAKIAELQRTVEVLQEKLDAVLAQRESEYCERFDHQSATIDVLKVMSASPGDPQPVFDLIVHRATEVCNGEGAALLEFDGELVHFRAYSHNAFDPSAIAAYAATFPMPPTRESISCRAILDKQVVHIRDTQTEPGLSQIVRNVLGTRMKSQLSIPLLRDGRAIGVISLASAEPGGFSDSQIELLKTFAEQAVIAIGSAATFRVLRKRTSSLQKSLEQQTATAEVLRVINASPGNLAPVFAAILDKAHHLCGAAVGSLVTYDGECCHVVATHGFPEQAIAPVLPPFKPNLNHRALFEGARFIHIPDLKVDEASLSHDLTRRSILNSEMRTSLYVPLRKDSAVLGFISAFRPEVCLFSEHEIALLESFATQAVIAIENTRLITELREALDQQTAIAEVLRVINASPGNLTHVFDTMLDKAMGLCEAAFGELHTFDADRYVPGVTKGVPAAYAYYRRQNMEAGEIRPGTIFRRIQDGAQFLHIVDLMEEGLYREGDAGRLAMVNLGGARTLLAVPLRKDEACLGMIAIFRQEVRPFSERQIALLKSFAAQAVVAMENARLLGELQKRTSDLQEALEYQTATSDVLKVISRSTFDVGPVFQAVAETAARLCNADQAAIYRGAQGVYRWAASYSNTPEYDRIEREVVIHAGAGTLVGRVALERHPVQILDAWTDPLYEAKDDARVGGIRTLLGVPLLRDEVVIGVIGLARRRIEPYTETQIQLVNTFADQAVIAIQNARLITEQREALEQQTATAEVLRVINTSPGDLRVVFDAILEKAQTICGATMGVLLTYDGECLNLAASRGTSDVVASMLRRIRPIPDSGPARLIAGERLVTIPDCQAVSDPVLRAFAEYDGIRTVLLVPLRKDREFLGFISANRRETHPFTDSHIALLENFAAQAVIAMENARLINEQREALRQQTATADVLQVINASPGELEPVFDVMLEKAMRLCEAAFGILYTYDGERFQTVAERGLPEAFAAFRAKSPPRARAGGPIARLLATNRPVQVADLTAEAYYRSDDAISRAIIELGGARSFLMVPLSKDGAVVGTIVIYRQEVRPFSEKQTALLENFAAQAVIAMENARLLRELRERTVELTSSVAELKALEEVLRAVNSSLDSDTVLTTIISRAVHLSQADEGTVYEFDEAEEVFLPRAAYGMSAERVTALRERRIKLGETYIGRSALQRTPIHVADVPNDPSLGETAGLLQGVHALLAVPLLKADKVLGGLVIRRRTEGGFAPTIVTLMQTFAGQCVLAIENARLFQQLAEKSQQLQLASEHKSQFLANMSHELRTPLNAILGYTELLVDGIYGELPQKPRGVLDRVLENGRNLLALINDVLDLVKIEAGQFTLSLERYEIASLVRDVAEALQPLAHGKGLSLIARVADDMPAGYGDSRRLRQVLVNLVGNAIKFTDAGEVEINAASTGGRLDVTVRDTGPGIEPGDQEKIFEEFQQVDNSSTRRKGGTGLGLAISRRIVRMHGGHLSVVSTHGRGSTFHIDIPVWFEPDTQGVS